MYIYVYALLSNNALRFAQRKKKHEKKEREEKTNILEFFPHKPQQGRERVEKQEILRQKQDSL